MALVLDTSVLLAALDAEDPAHEECARLLEDVREEFVIPAPVLVELDYWMSVRATPDAWLAFCEQVASGAYEIHDLTREELVAAAGTQVRYGEMSLDFVDASVFVTCQARGERKVATLDRRDFSVLRLPDGSVLEILPA